MSNKRPSFQFYPSDWLRDTALRTCSEGARGIWIDMICYMHEGSPYGYMKVKDKVILPATLARMVGCPVDTIDEYLSELVESGVVQVDDEGCYYSKRLVKDETLRNARAAGGKLGGNPKLIDGKVNLEDNLKDATKDKQKPTPSSSSSSSSSEQLHTSKPAVVTCPTSKIIELYKTTVSRLPHPRVVPDVVKQNIAARWREDDRFKSLDFWQELFQYVDDNKFLSGQVDGRDGRAPFRATLQWIVKAANFAKILNEDYSK